MFLLQFIISNFGLFCFHYLCVHLFCLLSLSAPACVVFISVYYQSLPLSRSHYFDHLQAILALFYFCIPHFLFAIFSLFLFLYFQSLPVCAHQPMISLYLFLDLSILIICRLFVSFSASSLLHLTFSSCLCFDNLFQFYPSPCLIHFGQQEDTLDRLLQFSNANIKRRREIGKRAV